MRSSLSHSLSPRRRVAALAGVLLLSLAGRAMAADHIEAVDRTTLRVCSDPASLPFSNHKQQGFENKIADLLAQELKVPVKYTWYPDATGFLRNTLNARRCDLVMGIASGAELVLNTNPYYRSSYVIVTRRKDNVRPYQLVVDTRFDSPGKLMIEDLAKGEIDVALLWGPIAGYYAKNYGDQLMVTPLVKEAKDARMDFYITMGVRPNEIEWKRQIDKLIKDNRDKIVAILKDYGIPLLDAQGQPLP